ncbi:MAG: blue (type 1) copper domain protein [Caulobacter sp.]|nr:blue (type 1) copper domain protein [Caulobacter sp.]
MSAKAFRAPLTLAAATVIALTGAAAFTASVLPPTPAAARAPAQAVTVHISNFTFNAPTVTIGLGTTVTWVNDDDIPHTVVATDRSFKSKPLDTGDRFSFTFTKPGEVAYFCSLHPHMTGKVVVRAT